jgi:NADPH-dependent 2,4-dienoyl-CoA reductase/sulfur reductase-like enzyme
VSGGEAVVEVTGGAGSWRPLDPSGTVVAVGAGLAGLRSCEALRAGGFTGRLVLVGDEPLDPYDRPPLSKQYLAGDWDADRLALRRSDQIDRLGLELRTGLAAAGVSVEEQTVALQDGTTVGFDGLVVATGAHPRRLAGADLAGVHVLRTKADADVLAGDLRSASRLVVVGAGFIGTEVAATARQLGLAVTVVEPLGQPLGRVLPAEVGAALAELHRRHGVAVLTGSSVTAGIDQHGGRHPFGPPGPAPGGVPAPPGGRGRSATGPRVSAVELADGQRLPAEVVLVAVGVAPAVGWLSQSGLVLDDGVVVDRCLRAAPSVVAAGDVARWPVSAGGPLRRIEHWTNASEQGVAAAASLLAGPAADPYEPVPYVWSDQYEAKLQVLGLPAATDELVVLDGSLDEWRFLAVTHRAGALTGALAVGRPRQLMTLRPLVQRQAAVAEAVDLVA